MLDITQLYKLKAIVFFIFLRGLFHRQYIRCVQGKITKLFL